MSESGRGAPLPTDPKHDDRNQPLPVELLQPPGSRSRAALHISLITTANGLLAARCHQFVGDPQIITTRSPCASPLAIGRRQTLHPEHTNDEREEVGGQTDTIRSLAIFAGRPEARENPVSGNVALD